MPWGFHPAFIKGEREVLTAYTFSDDVFRKYISARGGHEGLSLLGTPKFGISNIYILHHKDIYIYIYFAL